MNFTILTISMRHDFVATVARSISEAVIPSDVDVRWHLKMNPPHRIPWERHIEIWDREIRMLKDTWFLIVSDDNILHPKVIQRWRDVIEHQPHIKAMHVRQQYRPDQFRPAGIDHLNGGLCDGGQVLFDADFFNSFGYAYDQFGTEGELFRKMYDARPNEFFFLDEHLAFHDKSFW